MEGSSQVERVPNSIYPGPEPCVLMQGDDLIVTAPPNLTKMAGIGPPHKPKTERGTMDSVTL